MISFSIPANRNTQRHSILIIHASSPKNLTFTELSDAGGGQTDLSITIKQSEVPESFKMQLPLYAVINGQPQYIGLVGVSGNQPLKSSVKLPVRPEQVVLDPYRSILAEIRQ